MSDILSSDGAFVDAKTYDLGRLSPQSIERLRGGADCVLRLMRPADVRSLGAFAADEKVSVFNIDRGRRALGGFTVVFATADGLHTHEFNTDNICVDPNNNEIGYVVGTNPPPVPKMATGANASFRFARTADESVTSTSVSASIT